MLQQKIKALERSLPGRGSLMSRHAVCLTCAVIFVFSAHGKAILINRVNESDTSGADSFHDFCSYVAVPHTVSVIQNAKMQLRSMQTVYFKFAAMKS